MPTLTLDGTTYEVDLDHVSVKEMRQLKEHGGLTVASLAAGWLQGDVDAIQGVVWLGKRRAGEAVRWQDLDEVDLMPLIKQIAGTQFRILMIAHGPAARWADRLRALADEIDAAGTDGEPDPTTPPAGDGPSSTG